MHKRELALVAQELDERRAKRVRRFTPIPTRAQEARRMSAPIHPLTAGHAVFDALRAKLAELDQSDRPRSPNQVLIHTLLMSALCMHVYGSSLLAKHETEIKRYNGFSTTKQEIALTMPRRSGKTVAVASFIAAALLTVPGFECASFAAAARSAGADAGMLGVVKFYLLDMFGVDKSALRPNNAETIGVTLHEDKRVMHSYPGSQDTLRGVGGNFVVVEESSYIKDSAYYNIIVPLLALKDVAAVFLSTLGEDVDGWFNKLIASDHVHSFVVKYVCDVCEAKGLKRACVHNEWMLPHWSSSDRMEMQMKFYGEERRETFLRESVGLVEDTGDDRVFSQIKVRDALAAPAFSFNYAVKHIFVAIDPVAGTEISEKNQSDFAVVAVASPLTVIMGIEALNIVRTEEYRPKLEMFLRRLRAHPMTECATLVVDVEMGTGLTAPDIYAWVAEKFRNVTLINDLTRKEGSLTTHKAKQEMMEIARYVLLKDEVRFWEKFVTSEDNAAAIKDQWAKQMMEYKRLFVKGKSITSKNSYVLSGKGENKDKKDDISVTFQRAVRLRDRFEHDPKLRARAIV
jgi:hypothetical protein